MEGEMCECEGKKMDKQGEGGREGGEQRKAASKRGRERTESFGIFIESWRLM